MTKSDRILIVAFKKDRIFDYIYCRNNNIIKNNIKEQIFFF